MTAEWTASLPRKRMGAGVLFRRPGDDDRVLLVEPTYKPDWEIPGGVVEADESPRAAAAREVAEEVGLTVVPGRLLVADWVPPIDGRTEGLMMLFDGGVLDAGVAITLPAEELRSWTWATPQEVEELMLPFVARRVTAARHAAVAGTTVYLELGFDR